jgi:transcriptional regulator with GAF, ATPase, and Fis domain
MRNIVNQISLVVLLPLFVAAMAVLALLIIVNLPFFHNDLAANLVWVAMLVGTATFIACSVPLYLVLLPMRRFLDVARDAGVIPKPDDNSGALAPKSDMEEYQTAFEQVGQALSRMDASALFPEIIGHSQALRCILGQVLKVAPTNVSVLITGESGTGKELVAQAIHAQSQRRDGPLEIVNCAAIPENLLESELFGYEKGAFTGATSAKPGRFELAHKGTLFLDEVGDMPLAVQAKILRMLETGSVQRVGGVKSIRCDVRVVAATNRDLQALIQQSEFRGDLFHRLNVFPLHLPPLRKRREDIPVLVEHFLAAHGDNAGISIPALQLLMAHDWPGNVRELRNTLERAVVLAGSERIFVEHFPSLAATKMLTNSNSTPHADDHPDTEFSLDQRLDSMERSMIETALARTGGIQAKAARILGIKERSLWHRIKKLDIDPKQYK